MDGKRTLDNARHALRRAEAKELAEKNPSLIANEYEQTKFLLVLFDGRARTGEQTLTGNRHEAIGAARKILRILEEATRIELYRETSKGLAFEREIRGPRGASRANRGAGPRE